MRRLVLPKRELERVTNNRIRQRTLRFPVSVVEGRVAPCRVAEGRLYRLEAEGSELSMVVTAVGVERTDDNWSVRIVAGDVTHLKDEPRLLSARPGGRDGDYTSNPARALRGEPESVPRDVLERLSESVRIREEQEVTVKRARAVAGVEELLRSTSDRRARKRLRMAVNQIRGSGSVPPPLNVEKDSDST